jgi:hypothetical protein
MMNPDSPYDKCDECDGSLPKLALGKICRNCLHRRYVRVVLERERVAWTDDASLSKVEVGRGKKSALRHIALSLEPDLAYCGLRVSETRKRRLRVFIDNLPSGICTDCKAAFEHVQEMAARSRAVKGVSS